jgi:hypothetical protein
VAVNWFEGGRRISKLLMALVGLGGAAYVALASTPMATVESEPGEGWKVAATECPMTAYQNYWWDYDWGGDRKGLAFCFRPLDNGGIPYAVAPTPAAEAKRYAEEQAREAAEDKAAAAKGAPPPLRMISQPPKWYYTDSEYSDPVQAYARQRMSGFQMTPQLRADLIRNQKPARWIARWKALTEALPWVLGLCTFIWLSTAVLGWIVRGFAGVPKGSDFRKSAAE